MFTGYTQKTLKYLHRQIVANAIWEQETLFLEQFKDKFKFCVHIWYHCVQHFYLTAVVCNWSALFALQF